MDKLISIDMRDTPCKILRKIEESNYADIYLAETDDKKPVILKRSRRRSIESNEIISREYQVLSQIQHPNIVRVLDFDTDPEGRAYFISEFVDGKPINECIAGYSASFTNIFLQLLDALGALHNQGFVHTDLKPEHIIFDEKNNRVVLIDFGFAGIAGQKTLKAGTLGYIAPEVVKGVGPDQRSDLYSLGIIMYESLTGYKPALNHQPIEKIPPRLDRIIGKLVSSEPHLRPNLPEIIECLFDDPRSHRAEIPAYKTALPVTGYVECRQIADRIMARAKQSWIISGASGAGKTRHLKEIKYRLQMQDYMTIFFAGQDKIPFSSVFIEIFGIQEPCAQADNKLRVFEEIRQAIDGYVKKNKLAVLIDDLEITDDFNIGLIRYLNHGVVNDNFLIVGSAGLEMTRKLEFESINLEPFSQEEIQHLVKITFFEIETRPRPKNIGAFIGWLHAHTSGNPLFIAEILKALHAAEILTFGKNKWWIDLTMLEHARFPERIENLLAQKLTGLGATELMLMKTLTVCDHAVAPSIISALFPQSANLDLERLINLGLVRLEFAGVDQRIVISNSILRTLTTKLMNDEEYKKVASRIIAAVENRDPQNCHYHPMMARLSAEIGSTANTIKYLRSSAQEALKIHSYEATLGFYEKLIAVYTTTDDNAVLGQYSQKAGDLYQIVGNNHAASVHYEQALKSREKTVRANAYAGLGKLKQTVGDGRTALELMDKALALMSRGTPDHISATSYKAYLLETRAEYNMARTLIQESIARAQELGDRMLEAESRYYDATIEWYSNNHASGIQKAQDLFNYCRQQGLDKQLAFSANLLVMFLLRKGDVDRAENYLTIAIDHLTRTKQIEALISAKVSRGDICLFRGELKHALKEYEEANDYAVMCENTENQKACLLNIAFICKQNGDLQRVYELSEKALMIDQAFSAALCEKAHVLYLQGAFKKAGALLIRDLSQGTDPFYYAIRACVENKAGDASRARIFMEKGLDLLKARDSNLSDRLGFYLEAYKFYHQINDIKQAIRIAEQARSQMPEKSIYEKIFKLYINMNESGQKRSVLSENSADLVLLKDRGFIWEYSFLSALYCKTLFKEGADLHTLPIVFSKLLEIENLYLKAGAYQELTRLADLKGQLLSLITGLSSPRAESSYHLSILASLADIIDTNLGADDFTDQILDLIIETTGAERGALFKKTPNGMDLMTGRNLDRTTLSDAGDFSKTTIQAVDNRLPVFVQNVGDDPRFNAKKSVLLHKIRSILCLPLISAGEVIGAIYLDSRRSDHGFDDRDKDFLAAVSRVLASAMEKSNVLRTINQENMLLKSKIINEIGSGYLLGSSKPMRSIYQRIEKIANTNSPILVSGETGTGKGMIARLIHLRSDRKNREFKVINCGTIPETLLESELFGHRKGSFTDAKNDKKGLLEEAQGGTIFLDEITNTSMAFQARLLEAIEEKVIRRIGETITRKINVRFILATNRDLDIEVEENRFRKDLYYRINVFAITMPPLRERSADIPKLAQFFLERYANETNKKIYGFTPEAIHVLKIHTWPGNIRELQNLIEKIVVMTNRDRVEVQDIGLVKPQTVEGNLKALKNEAIIEALNNTNGNIQKAADILGINRRTIERFFRKNKVIRRKLVRIKNKKR